MTALTTGHALTEQLEIPITGLIYPDREEGQTIQQAFEAFHMANPWVYAAFERLTDDWLAHGHRRVGVGMLTEIVRWRYGRTVSGDGFKINNNFRSRYARKLIADHPQWRESFEVRELRAP